MDKVIFNFPKKYKRQLEKIAALLNMEAEKKITLSSLVAEVLIKEFDLTNEKKYNETLINYIKSQESNN